MLVCTEKTGVGSESCLCSSCATMLLAAPPRKEPPHILAHPSSTYRYVDTCMLSKPLSLSTYKEEHSSTYVSHLQIHTNVHNTRTCVSQSSLLLLVWLHCAPTKQFPIYLLWLACFHFCMQRCRGS